DFEVGGRHDLDHILVMHEDGTMNARAAKYEGMDRFECRREIVKDLQKQNVLFDIEDHVHQVGHSERSGAVVEPYLSTQWFVKMQPLADASVDMQQTDEKVNFVPIVLNILIYIGWKIFVTGVFLDNYGGVTVFLLGIIKKPVKYT